MDFYKLTHFQLYSIIHSRHLDKANKAQAERELQRRNLSEEELQRLADELVEKTKANAHTFFKLSPNVMYLVIAIVVLLLLRQCMYR